MSDKQVEKLCESLNVRRRRLRMSCSVLARRSGVSMPTVVRILSGTYSKASFANVAAVAEALGIGIKFEPVTKIADLREAQARQKARRLVGMVQGTSGLEAQALDDDELTDMTRQTVHELLAGSSRKLWSE